MVMEDVTFSKAVGLYFDPEFDYPAFTDALDEWGMETVEAVAQSNSNVVKASNISDFIDELYQTEAHKPSEQEVELFLDGLLEVGIITEKGLVEPRYNFSAINPDRPFSGHPEYVKAVFDEVEREAGYIEMQYGQATISDYSSE